MAKKSAAQVEEEHKQFLIEFSYAVLRWQHVEGALFNVFSQILKGSNYVALGALFYSIINLNARLSATEAAAEVILERYPDLLERWYSLSKRIGKLAKRRNQMAHSTLAVHDEKNLPASVRHGETYLRPAFTNPMAGIEDEFDVRKIIEIGRSFDDLYHDLMTFHNILITRL